MRAARRHAMHRRLLILFWRLGRSVFRHGRRRLTYHSLKALSLTFHTAAAQA